MRKAVVLLSGGLDSTTTMALAREGGFAVYAITFRYGQRHDIEVEAAREIARLMGANEHLVVDINLRMFGHSSLTGDIAVPKGRSSDEISHGIPTTYVPARNTIFLSFALAWAEVLKSSDIFIGVNAIDYSGYPDCRLEYIKAFEAMANLATKAAVEGNRLTIHAPLIDMTKADIIQAGVTRGVDYALTRTCYDPSPNGEACGECDACAIRLKAFAMAGMPDPAPYRSSRPVTE